MNRLLDNSTWLHSVVSAQPLARKLLEAEPGEQRREGYFHTLREICQQPSTWRQTRDAMLLHREQLGRQIRSIGSLILTGSGSSEYAGDCVRLVLQSEMGMATQALGGGMILTQGARALPSTRPSLVVSLSRSGGSPESAGALALLLESEPEIRHLVITCNGTGTLAKTYRDDPRVTVIALDDRTNDRSLVMTSSFTNMVLAARFLGLLERPGDYYHLCERLSGMAENLLANHFDCFAKIAKTGFRRAVFLGSGSRYGAAREAALKMLEMTAGRVGTLCETFLGLRHGPMSYVNDQTIVVCFLSSDPVIRAYEADLLRELDRKKLGLVKLIAGENVPSDLLREGDFSVECEGIGKAGDENVPVLDAVCGQLLAFFRCLEEGLQPDAPSENGVINRVVENFSLHRF